MGQQTSSKRITTQDKTIFQLKQQRDKLRQYQTKINDVRDRQEALARKSVQENQNDKARFYLRAKRHQDTIISKTYDQIETLERLIGTIEYKLVEKDVIKGLQEGNSLLKELNSEMSIEKIDEIMDDLEEERLKVDEVSDALGIGSALTDADRIEIDEELARLEYEELQAGPGDKIDGPQLPLAPSGHILPNVPVHAPVEAPPGSAEITVDGYKRSEAPQLA